MNKTTSLYTNCKFCSKPLVHNERYGRKKMFCKRLCARRHYKQTHKKEWAEYDKKYYAGDTFKEAKKREKIKRLKLRIDKATKQLEELED